MKLTDKQKHCPYCHQDKYGCTKAIYDDSCGQALHVFPNGSIEIDYDDDCRPGTAFSESGVFNYCPKCRRPLNEEDNDED